MGGQPARGRPRRPRPGRNPSGAEPNATAAASSGGPGPLQRVPMMPDPTAWFDDHEIEP